MNILLHADGGAGVGLGHASRCGALAAALARAGHRAVVAVDPVLGLGEYLARQGAIIVDCPGEANAVRNEAKRLDANIVVIDSYRWLARDFALLAGGDWRVVAFDDEATRELPVDAVVNGAPAADSLSYKTAPHTRLWLGASYQVIRDDFRNAAVRAPVGVMRRMIVLVGGDDPLGLLPIFAVHLEAVAATSKPPFVVELICGPFTQPPAVTKSPHVQVRQTPPDLRQRMLAADLALSASGQTLYELARCGTPMIAFCSGADQTHNLAALARAGVVWDAGDATQIGWLAAIDEAIRTLVTDPARREDMTKKAQRLIDGRGADRLVVVLEQLVEQELPSPRVAADQ